MGDVLYFMIMLKLGYDNIYDSMGEVNPYGSAQWCTFYITDDFSKFYDHDGEKYICNKLAPVLYCDTVQGYRLDFFSKFNEINSIGDLSDLDGVLCIDTLVPKS